MRDLWIPPQERRYSKHEVLERVRAAGYRIKERTLTHWIELGLLPGPDKDGLAGGGSVAWWSERQVELLLGLLKQYQQFHGQKTAFLCNIPVEGWLHWGQESGVTLAQVKRAMHTWAVSVNRTRLSQEKTRSAVSDLVTLSASRSTKSKREAKAGLTDLLTRVGVPDYEQLVAVLQPVVDPYGRGETKGPAEVPLTVETIASGLEARLWAVDQLLDEQRLDAIPEALWEWARANVNWAARHYQQLQPRLAQDQELGYLFRPHDWMEAVTNACLSLATILGAGVRALEMQHRFPELPPALQPELWVAGKIRATVRGQWKPSPILLPHGGRQFSLYIEMTMVNTETGETTALP